MGQATESKVFEAIESSGGNMTVAKDNTYWGDTVRKMIDDDLLIVIRDVKSGPAAGCWIVGKNFEPSEMIKPSGFQGRFGEECW